MVPYHFLVLDPVLSELPASAAVLEERRLHLVAHHTLARAEPLALSLENHAILTATSNTFLA